jgi:predicted DCC family thiol-disulfide oxidoreductase YuxK
MIMNRYILAYDKDCGNCTRFKRIVDILDGYKRLDFLSLTEADESGLLDPVPRSRRHRSFHLIYPGGSVISGSLAVPELISLLPSGRAASFLIRRAPGGRRVVNLIYSLFSRLHDTGSCSYPDDPSAGKTEVGKILPQERVRLSFLGRRLIV